MRRTPESLLSLFIIVTIGLLSAFALSSCTSRGFSEFMKETRGDDDADGGDVANGDDEDADVADNGGSEYPTYYITLVPDYARRKQYVTVQVFFPGEAEIDLDGDAGVYIAGRPDFGRGVFVRSWSHEPGYIKLTLYIDESAPTEKHVVTLLIEDGTNTVLGKGEFYILPALE